MKVSGTRIAVWQAAAAEGAAAELEARLELLCQAAAKAAAGGASLMLCPELYLCGYQDKARIAALAEPRDGRANQACARIAARYGIGLAYGFAERVGERIYNVARLLDGSGHEVLTYRKTHLYGPHEQGIFTPGDRLCAPATWNGLRVGLLICYDIEFPETARCLALQGAELLLVPTALPQGAEHVRRLLVPARAVENGLFVAYGNFTGVEHGLHFAGLSCVAGPEGELCASAGTAEMLIFADIDPARMGLARRDADYLAERRADLYGGMH